VQRARKVLDSGSEALIKSVEEGRVSVSAAAVMAENPPAQIEAQVARLSERPKRRVVSPPPEPEPKSSRRVDHEKRKAEVEQLHRDGLGTLDISRALNVEPSTVSSIKGRLGVANTGSVKLWRDIEHLAASLAGGAPLIDSLATRLGTEKFNASQEEVRSCIKTLSKVTASIRALSAALKEKST